MALSERSLRDLRKLADLDAKTEASNAAKEVADRRATALQDALAERAGRIAALERACRLPAGEDDDGAAAALEAAAEAAERLLRVAGDDAQLIAMRWHRTCVYACGRGATIHMLHDSLHSTCAAHDMHDM